MRRFALFVAAVSSCLLVAACGTAGGGGGGDPQPSSGFPVVIDAANGSIEIAERPERIVSLSPTATESLFEVGAGDQVVAVDDQSNYPQEAPTTDLSGVTPNIEAIATYEPDLVVIHFDPLGGDLESGLNEIGIVVLMQPAALNLDETYAQIIALGDATGHAEEASALVTSMRSDIEEIVGSLPTYAGAPTYYHELGPDLYSVTSSTFIGQLYGLIGLVNVADPADADGFGYPQLSPEFIVEADPDLIFLADTKCCGVSAAELQSRPGWNQLTAVNADAVIELDDDIASRWGPRVVDFLRSIADAVTSLS